MESTELHPGDNHYVGVTLLMLRKIVVNKLNNKLLVANYSVSWKW